MLQNHSIKTTGKNGNYAIDTACPAGLVKDYMPLVASPAPSHEVMLLRFGQALATQPVIG